MIFYKILTLIWIMTPFAAMAQELEETRNISPHWFAVIQSVFLGLIFIIYPLICKWKINAQNHPPLKGLNLPQGSIRAMIAISIIGSFLITLSIGPLFIEEKHLNTVLTAFGSLSGAVIGFYFGSRSSEQKTEANK